MYDHHKDMKLAGGDLWGCPAPRVDKPHLMSATDRGRLLDIVRAEQNWPSGGTKKLRRALAVLHDIAECGS